MRSRRSAMAISPQSGQSSPPANRASSGGAATRRRRRETSASPPANCREIFPAPSIDAPQRPLYRSVRSPHLELLLAAWRPDHSLRSITITIRLVNMVIVMRRVSDACRQRIGRRGVLIRRRRRYTGGQARLQQSCHDVLGIVTNQEATPYQLVHRLRDLVPILRERVITLFDRKARVARSEALGLRCLEGDVLAGSLASIICPDTRSQPPACVGRKWHRQFRQPDAGNVVAVAISLRHVARIDRAVRRIVLVGWRDDGRVYGRNEGLIE